MYRILKLILPLMVLAIGVSTNAQAIHISDNDVEEMLDNLDKVLKNRDAYIATRQNRIDSLTSSANSPNISPRQRLDALMYLADEYTGYATDSALSNYERGYNLAIKLGDDIMAKRFRLKSSVNLPLIGFIQDAVSLYEKTLGDNPPEELKETAYESGRQMYSYVASFYANYPEVSRIWNDKALDLQQKLLEVIPSDSPTYKLNQGEYYFLIGKYSEAKASLQALLDSIPDDSNLAARANHIMSQIAKKRDDDNAYTFYLIKSAISDLKSATREVLSLQELGIQLYEQGDINRGYNYLTIALANAVKCNASMRMLQTSIALPVIEQAHKSEIEHSRKRLYALLIGLVVLLFILAGTMIALRHEMKRMRLLQLHLKTANRVKEMYLSQFLNLCSVYMDKLNQFCKMSERKISTGHTDELYKMVKSGRFAEEHSKEFYTTFDSAFLHIYPNFIDGVNSLLRPEEVILPKDGELLNTDLRILAFMRLGVEESTRIAQVLNYSVYTIYTYRNRLKNKAINRNTFEADVMKIDSVS